ncbi:hypothetical protein GMORB2_4872 [Geosmithia morbida]|uniref:Aminoglycoside phosphotransferase domain-containing protein n=1 Tax=Geosmithia morbida TaxID=1094350 RepID=A0A9P4YPI0_9HYPO|nr:uncharacterized protein GMORB2_4872 [Geosmithia morbida]KAF4119353.1 hypothetical protein GMORB2_4872 [Geosmithia morbida]
MDPMCQLSRARSCSTPAHEPEMKDLIVEQWPLNPDGTDWDGTGLMPRVNSGQCPFDQGLGYSIDIPHLVREIEMHLECSVTDIPHASFGASNFGFAITTADGRTLIARLSRVDTNREVAAGTDPLRARSDDAFELAAYNALYALGEPFDCRPLYSRDADTAPAHAPVAPNQGRRVFVFVKADGHPYRYGHWRELTAEQKAWERTLGGDARRLTSFPVPAVEPTRGFCMALVRARIEAVFATGGDEAEGKDVKDSNAVLDGVRRTLLRLLSLSLPRDGSEQRQKHREAELYRFVLDHGDFGIHNMTLARDDDDMPRITSVFDWEHGCVVPAILSEPRMITTADLVLSADYLKPIFERWGDGSAPDKMAEYRNDTAKYYKELFKQAPEYESILGAGRDVRRIWISLRDHRNRQDSIAYFKQLETWAKTRIAILETCDRS